MNTIDTILKLSGHKDMKSFYKEFPDEDSFMAKHGGQFRKAMRGAKIKKAQGGQTMAPITPISTQQGWNDYYKTLPTGTEKLDSMEPNEMIDWAQGIPILGKFAEAAQKFKEEKRQNQFAEQWRDVTDIQKKSSQSIDVDANRPDNTAQENFYATINSGDKFFPVYGTDTNVLAKKGKSIPKAQFGTQVGDILQQIGGNRLTNVARHATGDTAGGMLGEAVGDAVSMIPGVGPIVSAVASPILRFAGNFIGMRQRNRTKDFRNQTAQNVDQMAMGKGMQGLFNTNNAYMASGGNVSNMESEGELRIGKGGAISLSYNPFLPDGGETIEFRGPSHVEGGMPIAYGNSPVEVEGGEPAVKLQSGGTDEDLVVFGDLTIPGRNKKFKSVVKDIAKEEAKQNRKAEKALISIEDISPTNSFDKLKLNSAKATLMGTTQKLKAYANEKQSLASLQEAINQTAEEMNIDANALSKGNIKMAKKGASIPKAQNGDTKPKGGSDALWSALVGPPYMLARGVRELEELLEKDAPPRNLYSNYNSPRGTLPAPYNMYMKGEYKYSAPMILSHRPRSPYAQKSPFPLPYYSNITGGNTRDNAPRSYREQNYMYGPESTAPIVDFGVKSQPSVVTPIDSEESTTVNPLQKAVAEAVDLGRKLRTPDDVVPPRMKTAYERYKYNDDETEITSLGRGVQQSNDKVLDILADLYDESDRKLGKKETLDLLMSGLDSLLPYFRPSDTERLDPRQLMGEMFALTDKEEPVQAQTFQPQLGSPYSVSFADQKNDVIAQVRSAQRMAGNNPAAQAMIASQATQALNKINAEEFRMNQGMADKVYGENTATMNQAQLQNLQILDNQYTRQAQAKSNTKARLQAALNSISDKYLKNELNNKTLATYENLYNYRFDDRGRKQNWNQPAQWNIEGDTYAGTSGREGLPTGYEYVYNSRGERIDVRRIPKTSTSVGDDGSRAKNGMNIARAIKSL